MRLSDYFTNKDNLTPEEMKQIFVSFLNENIAAPKNEKQSWHITPEHLPYLPDGKEYRTNSIKGVLSMERENSKDEDRYEFTVNKNSFSFQYEFIHWFYRSDGFSEGWDFDVSGERDYVIEFSAEEKKFIKNLMRSYDTPEQMKRYNADKLKAELYQKKETAEEKKDLQTFLHTGVQLASRFPNYSFDFEFHNLIKDASGLAKKTKEIPEGSEKGYLYTEDNAGNWSIYETIKTPTTLLDGTEGVTQNDHFELLASGNDTLYGKECFFRYQYEGKELRHNVLYDEDNSVKERFVSSLETKMTPITRVECMNPVHDGAILLNAPEIVIPHLYFDNVEIAIDLKEVSVLSEDEIDNMSDDDFKNEYYEYAFDAAADGEIALEISMDEEKEIHAYVIGDGNRFLYPEDETEEVSLTQTEKGFLRSLFGEELERNLDELTEDLE